MTTRKLIYSLILFFIIALGILGYFMTEGYDFTYNSDSIDEAIINYKLNTNHAVPGHGGVVGKLEIRSETLMVFSFNGTRDSIHGSIVKKGWNRKWKVIDMSGSALPIERHPGEFYTYLWNGIATPELVGYWGVIYNPNIETIVLKNNDVEGKASILDLPNTPIIWYKLYPRLDSENIEIMRAIDSKGNEIPFSLRN